MISIDAGSVAGLMKGIEEDIARAATEAMRETSPVATAELRDQVTAAGLGVRLANTWRWRTYPDQGKGRFSMQPAGYIWSRAPDIVDAFARGATILPMGGKRFLWIPTENVPRRGRGGSKAMTPDQVEIAFNQDIYVRRGKGGRFLAFIEVIRGRSRSNGRGRRRRKAGYRATTDRRLAAGRALEPVLMFVLVPVVRLPKLLDLGLVAERWSQRYAAALSRRLGAG